MYTTSSVSDGSTIHLADGEYDSDLIVVGNAIIISESSQNTIVIVT